MRVVTLLLVLLASAEGALSPAERQRNIESFEYIWKTVRDKHWDPKLNGVDWQALHDELRPQVEKADSMEKARSVMAEMLDRLKQSHFGIIPAEAYGQMQLGQGSQDGSTGLEHQGHCRSCAGVLGGEGLVGRGRRHPAGLGGTGNRQQGAWPSH